MNKATELLAVIAGADVPDVAEPDGSPKERFDRLTATVVAFERAYDKTYEGADPSTNVG